MNSTASPPEGPASRGLRETSKVASRHRQGRELLAHRELQTRGVQLARVAQSADVTVEHRVRLAQARGGRGERHLGAGELFAPGTRIGGVVEHGGERPAVLAHQTLDARKTLFDRVERAVLARDPLAVVAQLAGQILGLDHERAQTLGERVQARVDAGKRVQPRGGARHQLRAAETVGGIFGRERVRAGARGETQRIETAQASARGEQLVVLLLVQAGVVDL